MVEIQRKMESLPRTYIPLKNGQISQCERVDRFMRKTGTGHEPVRRVTPGRPLMAGGFGTLRGERAARTKDRYARSDRPRLLRGDDLNEGASAATEVFEGHSSFSLGGA